MTDPNRNWAQPEGGAPSPSPLGPAPAPTAKPRPKGGGITNAILLVAALVAVAGLAFAGGRLTAPVAASSGFRGGNGQLPGANGQFPTGSFTPGQVPNGSFAPGGVPGFGGDRSLTITGTVKSSDGKTMVITTADGTETTIDVSASTYHSQAAASASDVTAGSTVAVSVEGIGGFGRRPDASADPNASAAPANGTLTAKDVTITGK